MSERTDEIVEGLLGKRRLGSFYLADVRALDQYIHDLEARETIAREALSEIASDWNREDHLFAREVLAKMDGRAGTLEGPMG
jgi:hypothetical protein